jgi:hypothetical protein
MTYRMTASSSSLSSSLDLPLSAFLSFLSRPSALAISVACRIKHLWENGNLPKPSLEKCAKHLEKTKQIYPCTRKYLTDTSYLHCCYLCCMQDKTFAAMLWIRNDFLRIRIRFSDGFCSGSGSRFYMYFILLRHWIRAACLYWTALKTQLAIYRTGGFSPCTLYPDFYPPNRWRIY